MRPPTQPWPSHRRRPSRRHRTRETILDPKRLAVSASAESSLAARPSGLTGRARHPSPGPRHRRFPESSPETPPLAAIVERNDAPEAVPGSTKASSRNSAIGQKQAIRKITQPTTAIPIPRRGVSRRGPWRRPDAHGTAVAPAPAAGAGVGERRPGDLYAEAHHQRQQRSGQAGGQEPAHRLPQPRPGALPQSPGRRDRQGGSQDQQRRLTDQSDQQVAERRRHQQEQRAHPEHGRLHRARDVIGHPGRGGVPSESVDVQQRTQQPRVRPAQPRMSTAQTATQPVTTAPYCANPISQRTQGAVRRGGSRPAPTWPNPTTSATTNEIHRA